MTERESNLWPAEALPRQVLCQVQRTAEIWSVGPAADTLDERWLLLHGYGERAEEFLGRFSKLLHPRRQLVAPEGLSRFYLRRGRGAVGASWMTKAERSSEIDDYRDYLKSVIAWADQAVGRPQRTIVLGFSQGAATAARCVSVVDCDVLCLWGGLLPEDLRLPDDVGRHHQVGEFPKLHYVLGSEDPHLDATTVEQDQQRWPGSSRVHLFAGGHEISDTGISRLTEVL